jgi:hypothetical protein
MFGLVIDPRLTIHPHPRKNPTLPHQGLVWQCRVTRRCRIRVWFGVGAELLAKEIGFHHGVSESVLAMDGYASCLS